MQNWSLLAIILAMPRPITSSKVLLVADRRTPSSGPGAAAVRRFRLARLRVDGPTADPARLEHVKRD